MAVYVFLYCRRLREYPVRLCIQQPGQDISLQDPFMITVRKRVIQRQQVFRIVVFAFLQGSQLPGQGAFL